MPALRRAAGIALAGTLVGLLSACSSGGFDATPPPPPDQKIRSYVALGDGFTAAPYAGRTTDDQCLRSDADYPTLVAAALGVQDVRDVSCTGATTRSLTERTRPARGSDTVKAQLDAVHEDTDLVTIGMGIEDDGLLRDMFAICAVQPCAPGTTYYTKVLESVDRASQKVTEALRTISDRAPDAYVVVVGYPRLTPPPENACDAFPPQITVKTTGTDPVTYVLDQLNEKLRTAARQVGAGYVDVDSLSSDHPLCSAHPWVSDMHSRPGKAVAYHPVAAEQRAIAAEVTTLARQR